MDFPRPPDPSTARGAPRPRRTPPHSPHAEGEPQPGSLSQAPRRGWNLGSSCTSALKLH